MRSTPLLLSFAVVVELKGVRLCVCVCLLTSLSHTCARKGTSCVYPSSLTTLSLSLFACRVFVGQHTRAHEDTYLTVELHDKNRNTEEQVHRENPLHSPLPFTRRTAELVCVLLGITTYGSTSTPVP